MRKRICSVGALVIAFALMTTALCQRTVFQGSVRVAEGSVLPTRSVYKLENGVLTVEANLGSGLPVRAALDTGLPVSVLTTDLASGRGLHPGGGVTLDTPLGSVLGNDCGSLTVRINTLILEGMPFVATDLPNVLTITRRSALPGLWLGMPVFGACVAMINPDDHVVVFLPPEATLPRAAKTTPLDLTPRGMQVQARVNSSGSRAWTVSTGSPGTLIPLDLVKSLGLQVENEREVRSPTGGKCRIGTVTLKELTVGSVRFNNVRAVTVVSGHEIAVGVLGTDILLRHQLYINCGRRLIGFVPRKLERPPEQNLPGAGEMRRPTGAPDASKMGK